NDQGALTSVTDPSGRVTRWTRDRAGRITSETRSGAMTRYERDERGLVTSITGPSGALTRLIRNSDGYIVAIVGAAGGRIAIERYAGGLPMSVTTPGGGRWSIGVDLLGRPDLIEDPTGRTVLLRRGPLGRLAQIQDSRFGTTKLKRGLGGALNGIEDPAGRLWGLVRDMAGRVVKVQLPGERSVRLDRDILGEISTIDDGNPIRVVRDGAGLPTEAGALAWRWSSAGMLSGVVSPLLDLSLRHDASGRVESVESADGSLWLRLSRDFAGRVVAFEGAEGVITLQRDLAGEIVVESDGDVEQTLIRGPSGHVERLSTARGTWRWLRDATGHLLRAIGPRELSLGLVRDDAGRVTLSRLSTGALLHRRWLESGGVLERIEDLDGGQQRERLTTFDSAGRIVLQQDIRGQSSRRSYGPDGELTAIVSDGGPIYLRNAEGSFGPGEAMMLFDEQGRLMEARPGDGPAAWGIAAGLLSAFWDPAGALRELVGDHGVIRLTHDAFGRLSSIEDLERGRWTLSYDVRGRLRAVSPPEAEPVSLLWSPEGHLLALGSQDLVHTPDSGGQLWSGEEGSGGAVWSQGEADTWRHGEAAQGWPRRTPDGHIALFEGGPLIGPDGAVEPVSRQATVKHPPTPWDPGARGREALWPEALLPTTPWHEPLELVRALGGIEELEQGTWSSCQGGEEGLGWPSEERTPPLGPAPGQLPMREDAITTALICATLPGGEPLEAGAVVDVLWRIEADLIDVPPEMLGAPVETRRRW
ncbi:MAG: YD repeat-containing protein, partial [Myxococcota bacterium]